MTQFSSVFKDDLPGYNAAAGKCEAVVNMGPTKPPQRKGRMPLYPKTRLDELQAKFDELEAQGVFRRPQDIDVNVEYVNPSFLVVKPSGGFRLVTAFADVGRYCKPTPSKMPNVEETLQTIAKWSMIITTDLTKAFYQIPLSSDSLKYCGVVTPYKGVRVYTRCAMGMPGSETALEELLSLVLGPLIQEGCVCKLADDLYCGGSNPKELADNWKKLLSALDICNLRLSGSKTIIAPMKTTVLGWIWHGGSISASPHKLSALQTCAPPTNVKGMRSFVGAYKALSRVLPNCSKMITDLEKATCGLKSNDKIVWTDSLCETFKHAQEFLSSTKSIMLPRPDDKLWIVTDGSVKQNGIGATLYVQRNGKLHLAGFHSAKLKSHQVKWLPCEVEALAIASAISHFAPYIIQSTSSASLLTDSKPCVQAVEKLYRGEFSASPRLSTFLTIASRYQVSLQHLAGTANVPSDFASRNAPDCKEPNCQVCVFISAIETSVVYKCNIDDIMSGQSKLPFTSRSAWLAAQRDDADLRRVYAHLSQGTRPSRKETSIKSVKRYLQCVQIASDGLLVVKRFNNPALPQEAIVVPQAAIGGLLTVLHLKLNHPSQHQLKQVVERYFFCLNLSEHISETSAQCHTCQSIKSIPSGVISQSTEDPPEVPGTRYAADVLKRERQLIFVLRETVTSYTMTSIIPSEKADTLRSILGCLLCSMVPMDSPKCVVRCDPAPGFRSLANDDVLLSLGIQLDLGQVKNVNKNPVAEQAVRELEVELLKQEPLPGPVTELGLAKATSRLNSRIRSRGFSSREMWFQRDQFNNTQLPFSDVDMIRQQHESRTTNHPYSVKAKGGARDLPETTISVGDIVYLYQDKNKGVSRPRYIVASIDGSWAFVRKFSGSQLRELCYKVKLSECYKVPAYKVKNEAPSVPSHKEEDCDDPLFITQTPLPTHVPASSGDTITSIPAPTEPPPLLIAPPDDIHADHNFDTPADSPSEPIQDAAVPDQVADIEIESTLDVQPPRRSQRKRRPIERFGVVLSDF